VGCAQGGLSAFGFQYQPVLKVAPALGPSGVVLWGRVRKFETGGGWFGGGDGLGGSPLLHRKKKEGERMGGWDGVLGRADSQFEGCVPELMPRIQLLAGWRRRGGTFGVER